MKNCSDCKNTAAIEGSLLCIECLIGRAQAGRGFLYVHGLLTDAENDKVVARMQKRIEYERAKETTDGK